MPLNGTAAKVSAHEACPGTPVEHSLHCPRSATREHGPARSRHRGLTLRGPLGANRRLTHTIALAHGALVMSLTLIRQVCAAALLAGCALQAQAAAQQYVFSSNALSGVGSLAAQLGSAAPGASMPSVSGSFRFDAATAFTGGSGALGYEPGYAVYSGAVRQLSGQVFGRSFSDVYVNAGVANNLGGLQDVLSLTADATPLAGGNRLPASSPRQLIGFTLGDMQLSNVRLFWVAPASAWAGYALPSVLPTTGWRLALDFVPVMDPLNTANAPYYANTVFIDGVSVQAVPEPSAVLMMLGGAAVLAGWARRR